jgi:hypothetical protein
MPHALNLQVTKYNSAKRKIAEVSDTESAELVGLKRKRDRALHMIRCFTFNFKQENFLDFGPAPRGAFDFVLPVYALGSPPPGAGSNSTAPASRAPRVAPSHLKLGPKRRHGFARSLMDLRN